VAPAERKTVEVRVATVEKLPGAAEDALSSTRLREIEAENERLRRAVSELSTLNDLARAIGASRDPDAVMHTIVTRSIRAVHAQEGVITLVGAEHDDAQTLVREVMSSTDMGTFHLRGAVLGWMQLHQKPLLVHDPLTDRRFGGVDIDPGVRSLLAVPLIVRGRLTGVLAVYNKQGAPHFNGDDQRLLAIIASQSAQVIENARLTVEERNLARMREQMSLAADVQSRLLPDEIPPIGEFDVSGTSVAAETVGGDYYDVVPLADGRFVFCLGDVSGKGLPASLLMANVQAMVRLMCMLGFSSCQTMHYANELLCRCTAGNRFVTFFIAILDPSTGELEYCNAGHNPPLVVTAGGALEELSTEGAVLGMIPGFEYGCNRRVLASGEVFVIYSDGVTEALDPLDDEFGEERLAWLLQGTRAFAASTIVDEIVRAIRQHASKRSQSDDITILVVRRNGRVVHHPTHGDPP
jgi:sigma-B regulation protein RsbU (phosphoserine phosphatase)